MSEEILHPSYAITFTRSPVLVSGVSDGGRPARIRLGKRIIDCIGKEGSAEFRAIFRTKPGLKYLSVEVQQPGGSWLKIGQRLVIVYAGEKAEHNYALWLHEERIINSHPAPPVDGPRISVLMPVYNTPAKWLIRAIDSVREQTYSNWELCVADDASTLPHIDKILAAYAAKDPRIKTVRRPVNGHISAASNSALKLVTGEFTALFDHDDELSPNALAAIADAIVKKPNARLLYTDEDKIDMKGQRSSANFKPDWNPDLLLAQNYLNHLSVYRTDLMRELGGFRTGYEGAQDWDLALRASDRVAAADIVHVPHVLYHWRAVPGSTALKQSQKSYIGAAARKALSDHLQRNRIDGEILSVRGGHWRVRRKLPARAPLVSLIIPTRNRVELLRTCVESLLTSTRYPDYEILIIDNNSDDPETLAYFKNLEGRGIKILRDEGPFNYSALNNRAVTHARGEVLGFLNNDLELITPDWLEEMVSQAIRPEVGAVGAMLYFPDNRVQHAGVVLGIAGPRQNGGIAGHAFKYFPRGHKGSANRMRVLQNYSAVTAACLVVRRELFTRLGGFDEKHLAVAYNDVDFCLRLGAAGYLNVWTPFAEFYHYESASRGADDTPAKKAIYEREYTFMREQWGPLLDQDPAYNANLSLVYEDFSPSWPPRVARVTKTNATPPPR